jgi:aspartyl-tRNA(Asn)/glutamyl-tRNA(Gln) amidotransferase subunit C
MSLTLEEVHHIADLARLELRDDELIRYREQLSAILSYFQQLERLDTESVPPTTNVSAGQSSLRDDQIRPGLALDELLHNAPASEERLFRVPSVFED